MKDDAPWMNRKSWQNGRIASNFALPLFASLFSFLLWNGLTIAFNVAEWRAISRAYRHLQEQGLDAFSPYLLLPLLLLLNLLLLPQLLRHAINWYRLGRRYLTLDPYPGAIGGQIGGHIILPFSYRPGMSVEVEVNCIKYGGHLNYAQPGPSRVDSVQWRGTAATGTMPDMQGTHIRFVLDVEDGLPPTSLHTTGQRFYWSVRIQLSDDGYDQEFKIPVFAEQAERRSSIRINDSLESFSSTESLQAIEQVTVTQSARELRLDYAAGRHGKMGLWMLGFGMLSLFAAMFFAYRFYLDLQGLDIRYFGLLTDLALCSFALLFGTGFSLAGIYLSTNRLQVSLDPQWLKTERRVFGRRFSKLMPKNQIAGFTKQVSSQTGMGAQAEIYYRILARDKQGAEIVVGDALHGQDAERVEQLLNQSVDEISLEHEAEKVNSVPAWLSYVMRGLKLYAALMVVAIFVAFVLEFFAL